MERKVLFEDKRFQRFVDFYVNNVSNQEIDILTRHSEALCEVAEFLGSDADVLQSLVRISDENNNFWATMGYRYARNVLFDEILGVITGLKDSTEVENDFI
ncbi:MAG: hypothetical protein R3Y09_02240 [Clostridia bacterium]